MTQLTDQDITSLKDRFYTCDRYSEHFNFMEFARAIESLTLARAVGKPVWVAGWDYRNGTEIRVFDDYTKVEKWREDIARDNWEDLGLGELLFDADVYWDQVPEEWFFYEQCEVK